MSEYNFITEKNPGATAEQVVEWLKHIQENVEDANGFFEAINGLEKLHQALPDESVLYVEPDAKDYSAGKVWHLSMGILIRLDNYIVLHQLFINADITQVKLETGTSPREVADHDPTVQKLFSNKDECQRMFEKGKQLIYMSALKSVLGIHTEEEKG